MATIKEDTYSITRITRTIPKPHSEVLAKLQSSIKQDVSGLSILNSLDSKESFEKATNALLGPHGFMQFMQFQQFEHGSWMHLYGVHKGGQATRIIFGNPQIAITMLRHDVTAGLFVPVEAYIIERPDGKGTDVVQIKPSTLIAGAEGSHEALKQAAEILDAKLDQLWQFVAA
ncbi:hypothetical protein LTR56_008335 [Elasticomyces elasticus]|nr:hypothetical protein LTR56_008335 [Elasticomyces elasticus]KAK3661471.1 hypothetical protein LTR22_007481 [Elasticomyces elasticus]KAK4926172.1 hypothetical protein LTR49_006876 [Elasticomyces elasticus]KAK5756892.1 hypothetical protein LTS12_012971 [Elasticomyces elasticus]